MRHLPDVLNKICDQVPDTDSVFSDQLKKIITSCQYCSPEAMDVFWNEASEVINAYINKPPKDLKPWQYRVVQIWMDKDE